MRVVVEKSPAVSMRDVVVCVDWSKSAFGKGNCSVAGGLQLHLLAPGECAVAPHKGIADELVVVGGGVDEYAGTAVRFPHAIDVVLPGDGCGFFTASCLAERRRGKYGRTKYTRCP